MDEYLKNEKEEDSIYDADRMILGDGCVFSTDTNETGVNNNVLVVGGSGSGKTLSIAEPLFLETRKRSMIAAVTKRKIVDKYSLLMKARGYHVMTVDFVHPERGNIAYDPLDFIMNFTDISFVAQSIILAGPKKEHAIEDPYWNKAAAALLSAFIAYVLMTKKDAVFEDVLEMLDNLHFEEISGKLRTSYDREFQMIEKKDPSNFAVVNFRSFSRLPFRTASCVYGILNTIVSSVFTPELRKMFHIGEKIDFEQLALKRTILFVIVSPVNPSLNCFVNMFYAHAFKQLFEFGEEQPDGMLPVPVHILADDFATGCPIPLFDQYISIFREKGISVTLLIQSESQLVSLYGLDAAKTIINNCDSYVFMGSNDVSTAQSISLRINRPLTYVLNMELGTQILFRRGEKPKIGKRYKIFEDKLYQKTVREYEQYVRKEKENNKEENRYV